MVAITPSIIHELAQWLQTHDCYDLQEVTVTIGQQQYPGCKYKQDQQPGAGARNQQPYLMAT